MLVVGLGKVVVATAGTPVQLSATKLMCHVVQFSFDPADGTATALVKDSAGRVFQPVPAAQPLIITAEGQSNSIDLSKLYVDMSTGSGKGPYVGYQVA